MSILVVQVWVQRLYTQNFVYKEKERRGNVDIAVNEKYFFEMERYYQIDKTIPQIK